MEARYEHLSPEELAKALGKYQRLFSAQPSHVAPYARLAPVGGGCAADFTGTSLGNNIVDKITDSGVDR